MIVEKTRSMLAFAGLSKKFWVEGFNTIMYLTNCSIMNAVSATPERAWIGIRINLGHLIVFGCRSFVCTCGEKHTKSCEESKEYIITGYCEITKDTCSLIQTHPQILFVQEV
jgi:hypothetical protein